MTRRPRLREHARLAGCGVVVLAGLGGNPGSVWATDDGGASPDVAPALAQAPHQSSGAEQGSPGALAAEPGALAAEQRAPSAPVADIGRLQAVIDSVLGKLAVLDDAIRSGDARLEEMMQTLDDTEDPADRRRMDEAITRLTTSLDGMEAQRAELRATTANLQSLLSALRDAAASSEGHPPASSEAAPMSSEDPKP